MIAPQPCAVVFLRQGRMPRLVWLAVAVYVGMAGYFIFRPNVVAQPLLDDAFYDFSIARNIAAGEGITYAGEQTNGFQPLYVFILAGLYYVFWNLRESDVMLRLILGLNAATILLAGYVLGRVARLRTGEPMLAALGIAAWLCCPFALWRGLNGLETGLVTLLMLLTVLEYYAWFADNRQPTSTQALLLGVTVGAGILARIDFVILAVILAAAYVIRRRTMSALARVGLAAVLATVIASPWFMYNKSTTGHWMPISATATSAVGEVLGTNPPVADRLALVIECAYQAAPFGGLGIVAHFAGGWRTTFDWSVLVVLLAIGWSLRRTPHWRDYVLCVAVFMAYAVVYARQSVAWWFFARYMFPATSLLTVAMLPVAALVLKRRQQALALPEATPAGSRPSWRGAAVNIVMLVYIGLGSMWTVAREAGPNQYGQVAERFGTVEELRRANYEGPLGAFQSGVIEYFLPGQIINLDGKVSAAALDAIVNDRLDQYILDRGIRYLVDWDAYTVNLERDYPDLRLTRVGRIGRDIVCRIERRAGARRPFTSPLR